MNVDIYLHFGKTAREGKNVYSVRRQTVLFHTTGIVLQNVQFIVHEAGRQQVLRKRQKNVHAFVRGWLLTVPNTLPAPKGDIIDFGCEAVGKRVWYDPYITDCFRLAWTAPYAILNGSGVYITSVA